MVGSEFKAWRESHSLTQNQLAERMKVTRTTIQNWEAMPGAVPTAVNMAASFLDSRLKQENSMQGPVTLIYSDGPMFVEPYGPRPRPATMQQEAYPSNVMALARVQALWGRDSFCNPFIIEKDGAPIWNTVELGRVANGTDTDAPSLINLLRKTAQSVRESAHLFVRSGARSMTPDATQQRQAEIQAQADRLDKIADAGLKAAVERDDEIEATFKCLRDLGTQAPNELVFSIHHALEIFSQSWAPRIEGPNFRP
ncbi:helix-turn-helix domain-containing protein [Methylovirgula sp. 4M-Z18]|uniref:helix-turn-helix domain-containing protein n=1 Tax=Methylovirgula sp. 4M-Z18 TaxID=2293567 RepID=UPI001314C62D|nr:helix-turn-helix transcriptional regulator [Methylovirgula sp. 4M-Z18]